MNAITGNPAASGVIHSGTAKISNDLNASVPFKSIADPHQTGAGNIPRAYLNVMFFNERFEFVPEGSSALRVSQPGDNASPLVLSNIKAPKNGYVYVYLSNENDDAVYFDNFTVSYSRGRIIEENHYYAFGLRIAGISSRKFDAEMEGSLKNGYLYNDKELWEDADPNWYDYGLRNYDAQIGRFTQLDPLTWDYPDLTNYQYASNDPINNIDIDGLEGELSTLVNPTLLKEIVVEMPKAAVKTASVGVSAINIASMSINALKTGLIVQDNLKSIPLSQNMAAKKHIEENNLLWKMLSKFSGWLNKVSQGSGSYQEYGIVFTGNDNGTMEFRDHAGKILDEVDVGALFGFMRAANLDPKVFRDLLSSPGGLKYAADLLEAGQSAKDVFENIKELASDAKESLNQRRLKIDSILPGGKKGPVDSKKLRWIRTSLSPDNRVIPISRQ